MTLDNLSNEQLGKVWTALGSELANRDPSFLLALICDVCSEANDQDENSFANLLIFGTDIAAGAWEPDELAQMRDSGMPIPDFEFYEVGSNEDSDV